MKSTTKPALTTSIMQLAINSTGRNPLHPETTSWKGRLAAEGLNPTKSTLSQANHLIKSLYKDDLRSCFTRLTLFDEALPGQSKVPLFFNQSGSPEPVDGSLNHIIGTGQGCGDIYTQLPLLAPFLLINTGKAFFLHCSRNDAAPALYTADALSPESPNRIRLSGISFGRKLTIKEEKNFRMVLNRYFSSKG